VLALLVVPLAAVLIVYVVLPQRRFFGAPSGSASASASASSAAEAPEDRTPEIRGRILDSDGNPVDDAAVRLVSPSPPFTIVEETKSDPLGRFSFEHVHAWRVRVVADKDPDGVVSSAELHAADGQTLEITLVLSAASGVTGTVVDTDDHPVAGAVLSIEGVPWTVRSATSDEAGAFRLVTVPQEATSLVAVARGFKTARVALGERQDQTELVVRVRLVAGSPVAGDVRDVDGNPVRARVVACEGEPFEARVTSGDDGTFQLPPSAIGCSAIAQHEEFGPSDAATVVEGRRLALKLKAGGAIEGVVVDESGSAPDTYEVGIESFSASRGKSVRSGGRKSFDDARGAFRLDKLAPGTYVLTASASGRAIARTDPIEVASGATTGGVRIVLVHGGTVTGHVYDDHHVPLAGADLRFDAVSSSLDSKSDATSDDGGRYRLEAAPVGPFTLRVEKQGYRVRLVSGLRVDSHGTLTQDITLTPSNGGGGLELGGIGATLQPSREGVRFANIFPGDPADKAGLKTGDRIVSIDGEGADGMSLADMLQRLRGQAGTSVGLAIERPSTGELLDVIVVRAIVVH
jgi:hypothetical protein